MKLIYTYLFKELLGAALATTGVLTFLLVLVNVFKDVFHLLLYQEVSLWIILKLIFLLIPFVLTFTLPWGVLVAVLIVFGRFSSDKELLALKASGIGLLPIIAPAIWVGILFSIFSFWINGWAAPQSRDAFKRMAYDVVNNNPMAFFAEQTPIEDFPGMRIWIGDKEGTRLNNVHIWMLDEKGTALRNLRADRGIIQPDLQAQRLVLKLFNARQEERDSLDPTAIEKTHVGAQAQELPLEISLQTFFQRSKNIKISSLTLGELQSLIANPLSLIKENPTPALTELQKRIALSMSCFTFVLVGIPLAIQTQRRETSVGVALSLAIVLGYYFITIMAEALKKNADVYPEIIIWLPNILFQVLGICLIAWVNFRK